MGRQFFKNVDFSVTYPLKGVQVTFGDSFLQDSVRCLSVLDLVILFYLFIFFLGRESQKIREWGVNSLKTSIFPLPTPLRGCRSLLDIVFLQDSVRCLSVLDLVILFYLFIFFLGREAQKIREWGVNSLKTQIFSVTYPLKGVQVTFRDSYLQDSARCFSALDLVILFYLFIFFLGREAQKVREWGVNSLKTSIFPLPTPLSGVGHCWRQFFVGQCEVFVCLGFGHFILFFYFFPFPRSSKGP